MIDPSTHHVLVCLLDARWIEMQRSMHILHFHAKLDTERCRSDDTENCVTFHTKSKSMHAPLKKKVRQISYVSSIKEHEKEGWASISDKCEISKTRRSFGHTYNLPISTRNTYRTPSQLPSTSDQCTKPSGLFYEDADRNLKFFYFESQSAERTDVSSWAKAKRLQRWANYRWPRKTTFFQIKSSSLKKTK